MTPAELKSKIREIPDFPKKGILFYDITTLLKDADAFREAIKALVDAYRSQQVTKVVAIESRGFIFGAPVARELKAGFVPVRKSGKLPAQVHEASYTLEYGTNTLAIHQDAIASGEKTLIVDDLLATGGTARAAADLVQKMGGVVVGVAFLIELTFLKGRDRLTGLPVFSLLSY